MGHAPSDQGHDPDRWRSCSSPAIPLRPHGPGRPGRRRLSARRREPRCLRRAPDRVRARRDHADRHPGRRRGVPDRCRHDHGHHRVLGRDRWRSTGSTGSRARSPSRIRPPASPLSPEQVAALYALEGETSARPSSTSCSSSTSAGTPSSSPPSARSRRRRPQATDLIPVVRAVDPGDGITTQVGGAAASGYDFLVSQAERARTRSA